MWALVHHHRCDDLNSCLIIMPNPSRSAHLLFAWTLVSRSDWKMHSYPDKNPVFHVYDVHSLISQMTKLASLADSSEAKWDYKCSNLNLLRVQDVHREVKGAQHDVAVSVAVMRSSLGGGGRGVSRARWSLCACSWRAWHGISSTSRLRGLRRGPLDEMNDLSIDI